MTMSPTNIGFFAAVQVVVDDLIPDHMAVWPDGVGGCVFMNLKTGRVSEPLTIRHGQVCVNAKVAQTLRNAAEGQP